MNQPVAGEPTPSPTAAATPWGRRLARVARRVVVYGVASVAGLGLLSWAAVPLLLPRVFSGPVTEALGRPVSLQGASFNPLALRLSLEGLKVAGATPQAPALFELERLTLDVAGSSLWRLAPVVEALKLERPRLRLARLSAGHYDVDDLIARFSQPSAPAQPADPNAPLPRFALHNLLLEGGELLLDDQPMGRQHHLSALKLGLPFLSNLEAADVAITVAPQLSFAFNGTPFAAQAQSTPFAADKASRLTLNIGAIDLAAWQPYVPASVPLVLTQGTLATELALRFAAPPQAPMQVALSGQVELAKLALADRQGASLASLGLLRVKLGDVQPLRQSVNLEEVRLQDVRVNAQRAADGSLNWLRALQANTPAAGQSTVAATATGQASQASQAGKQVVAAASGTGSAGKPAAPGAGTGAGTGAWALRLQRLSVEHVALAWQDESVRPAAALTLDLAEMEAQRLHWPLAPKQPPASLHAVLRALPGVPPQTAETTAPPHSGQLTLEASLAHSGGQAHLSAQGWTPAPLASYIAQWFKPRVQGTLGFEASAQWQGLPGEQPPQLKLASLRLEDVQLFDEKDLHAAALAGWRALEVSGVTLDLAAQQVQVQRVALNQPHLLAQRDALGDLNLLGWLRQAPGAANSGAANPSASSKNTRGNTAGPTAKATPTPATTPTKPGTVASPKAQPGWRVLLGEFALDGARLRWRDAGAPGGAVALDVSPLSLNVKALAWPAQAGLPISTQGQLKVFTPGTDLNNAGQLRWQGKLGLAPVAWQGSASMQRLPLHALVAYGGTLPVEVVRAELGLQTQSQVRLLPAGLSAQVQGDVRLTDVMVRTPTTALRAGDELLSWQALGLSGLRVVLAPGQLPQVDLTQGSLSDFYARLLITEQGQLNLNDLRPPAAAASAASAAAPAQSASQAASPASPASSANGLPLKLQVAGLKLSNGRVDFTDRFIRPNYSAALSELNGSFGRFGTEVVEAAPLLLNGKVAGTGLLNIQGSLNPLARPLALDVQASARDLELAPLTPYSAKYAGLPIERGKLSVDVRYRIAPDGQLKASNQVVLNQLTFGDAVDSPDATKLPVRLAVALLTDRHGVIDVNLPVSGSINDPQFSIGGVVLKVIGNLIVKAVTAPFSLLMGENSADSLSQVQFEPGTTRMRGDAEQALNRIAEALNNRPALKMTVTGAADPQTEREAIQHTWLEERLLAERRQELLRAGAPMDAPVPALGAPDRERLLRRLQSALRTAKQLGPFSQPTPAQLEAELKASHLVTADSARELALQRGLAVRDALIARGLARERLFLAAPRLRLSEGDENASGGAQSNAQSNAQSSAPGSAPGSAPSDAAWSPSVQLSLGTN